jgi:hypothetical protein
MVKSCFLSYLIYISGWVVVTCDTFWFCRGTTVCGLWLWLCYWSINPFLCWIRFSFHFLYCDFPLLTHAVKEKWGCTYQMWYILYTILVAQTEVLLSLKHQSQSISDMHAWLGFVELIYLLCIIICTYRPETLYIPNNKSKSIFDVEGDPWFFFPAWRC